MNRILLLTALIPIAVACDSRDELRAGSGEPARAAATRCTSTPCGNTASGKDPSDERLAAGEQRENLLRSVDDDKARWSMPIYSTSERPEDLALEVVRKAKLHLRLAPLEGHLIFSAPDSAHVFAVASPASGNGVCPAYNLHVIDASEVHVLFKRICRKFEYKPGRFARSVTYYLYDRPTGSMREIWSASAGGEEDPLPDARPTPEIRRIPEGYQFDWSGVYPGTSSEKALEIRHRLVRVFDGAGPTLRRIDLANGTEDESSSSCEGADLERVHTK